MKKKIIFFIIIIVIIILVILKIIPYLILRNIEDEENSVISVKGTYLQFGNDNSIWEEKYNLSNMVEKLEEKSNLNIDKEQYEIILENDLYYTFEPQYNIDIEITNLEINSEYKVKYMNNEKILNEGTNKIEIELLEGINEINVQLLKDDKPFFDFQKQIYYIKEYKNQFLDEMSLNAISTHFQIIQMIKIL